jgi:hypothetical protein
MGTMIKLLNKILAKFQLELISTKVDTSLVEETVKFLNTIPKSALTDVGLLPPYVGDINYVKERVEGEFPQVSGTTYFKSQIPTEKKPFFNFDGEKLDEQELVEKLKNE